MRGPLLDRTFEYATAGEGSTLPMPSAALVFAHPDDEVIGLGARLGRFREAWMIHVTDGAPRNGYDSRTHGFAAIDDYRCARQEELGCALALAGLESIRRENLAIPDQEASHHLCEITRRLVNLFAEQSCQVVFTHPYEGGHPDHDACAFAVARAVAILKSSRAWAPSVVECAFYHAGASGTETGAFLPRAPSTEAVTFELSSEEGRRKRALLDCFVTQRETLRAFTTERERFRIAPGYDFYRPPHPGPTLCDHSPWGTTSQAFSSLARAADATMRAELGSWE